MSNGHCGIRFEQESLWTYQAEGKTLRVAPPVFCLDGEQITAAIPEARLIGSSVMPNGATEYRWEGEIVNHPELSLESRFWIAPDNPVVRFCYVLKSSVPKRLTNSEGRNRLRYLEWSVADFPSVTEVRVGTFAEAAHSFCLEEVEVPGSHFENRLAHMGPILTATDGKVAQLAAYEHGSQFPSAYLRYQLTPDRLVALEAVKGNYFDGQILSPDHPFETIWCNIAVVAGDQRDLARMYRDFILRYQCSSRASREPLIFYNTWNYQERLKNWQGKAYLAEMKEQRMLAEIDVAHRLGIEVFVIDTGWYQKTGDWEVNRERFPNGLAPIKERLDHYKMRLGLWFNPTIAALTSRMWREHQDCIQESRGAQHPPVEVWETEASQGLCLVSRYAEAFAEELIRLVRDVGVTYFKWDAISQEGAYACDSPGHNHGGPNHSRQERAECYGFEQVRAMARIVERVSAVCPEAIFDFDVTEGERSFGLGFLAAGKYFLINNGPYHWNYDIPKTSDGNANLFFFPGPARSWICRTPLTFDKWLPSVLFLTHYFPDDPADSQLVNAASLVLGQNGIWGDLLAISEEGIARWQRLIGLYKEIRQDVTAAHPVRTGLISGSPEVHEKIALNGRGLVAMFASGAGVYEYITAATKVAKPLAGTEGVQIILDEKGRAVIRATFDKPSARLVFFGVKPE